MVGGTGSPPSSTLSASISAVSLLYAVWRCAWLSLLAFVGGSVGLPVPLAVTRSRPSSGDSESRHHRVTDTPPTHWQADTATNTQAGRASNHWHSGCQWQAVTGTPTRTRRPGSAIAALAVAAPLPFANACRSLAGLWPVAACYRDQAFLEDSGIVTLCCKIRSGLAVKFYV